MKKLHIAFIAFLFTSSSAYAAQYPNFSGEILSEIRTDVVSTDNNANNIEENSGYLNLEMKSSLNFNSEWSLKNSINLLPVSRRQYTYPERSRSILGNDQGINRGFNIDESALVVEEIKIAFENEDMRFTAGKFNPTFGTLYRRNKRIGFFVTDFTEDYELREKIGFSLSALLDDSEITVNSFFNDTTALSNSGINHKGKLRRNDGMAGNTGTLSSYSVTMEGKDFFGLRNVFYNIGYRSLGVNKFEDVSRETGYTINLEYLHKIGQNTYLIPLFEAVKIDNFTGRLNRNATYITTALIAKYSRWNASLSYVDRSIKNNYTDAAFDDNSDSILQASVGYKFENDIAIDLSRAEIKEDGVEAAGFGLIVSYLYNF